MSITSLNYLITIIVTTGVFHLLKPKHRNIYLVILSCGFIATYTITGLIYVIFFTLFNYLVGIKLNQTKSVKTVFHVGIAINLLQLVLLRYADFLIDPLIAPFTGNVNISKIAEIIVPVGISYFTLQGIGYLINVKMSWEKPERNFIDFLLYIIFFPKFLSGPIERSNHFLPQLKDKYLFDSDGITSGFRLILLGLFKKIAIANALAPYIVNTYSGIENVASTSAWVILLLQPLYLYFDFSGYTDIAIGTGRLFGIELLPNFNRPFFSRNMTNFWKRFHISLSSWFNDYIFRQTSFNLRRWGIYASITGLLVTWILFGIWHGAGWTFMLLGCLQALAIIYEFFSKKWRAKLFSKLPDKLGLWIGRFFTYLFFCVALVFFFAPDLKAVLGFFDKLINFEAYISFDGISALPFMLFVYIPIFLVVELFQEDYYKAYNKIEALWLAENNKRYIRWTLYSLMITILIIEGFKTQQFVYANF